MNIFTLYIDIEDISTDEEIAFRLNDECYEIIEDGSLRVNPKWGLTLGNTKNPRERTRDERKSEDGVNYCSDSDILIINEIGATEFCKLHNDNELRKLIIESQSLQRTLHVLPSSSELKESIQSIQKIAGKFSRWYGHYNFSFQEFEERLTPVSLSVLDEEKELWKGTRSEFVKMVKDNYIKSPDDYRSGADALRKHYNRYKFDFPEGEWRIDQAYDLFRK